jgi:hypothetical protein
VKQDPKQVLEATGAGNRVPHGKRFYFKAVLLRLKWRCKGIASKLVQKFMNKGNAKDMSVTWKR